jgi:probable F420-dependent oxidoreductase
MGHASCRPIRLGLYIPNGDGEMGAGNRRWRDVLTLAQRAEEVGFDAVWVADHLLFRFEGVAPQGRWECWSLLAALAACTSRVQLGPLVSCVSFRNPALLAKIAATVDEISGGRLVLGLGAGWHEPEYRAFGYPFDHRASRFEEGAEVIVRLLRGERVIFRGRYVQVQEAEVLPRGPRAHVPIMIGTTGDRLLRFAARHADLWNTTWLDDPRAISPLRARVDAACAAAGRDPATLRRSACVYLDLPGAAGVWSWTETQRPPCPREPEAAANYLRAFAAEGIDEVMLWLDPPDVRGVEAFARTIELLDRG